MARRKQRLRREFGTIRQLPSGRFQAAYEPPGPTQARLARQQPPSTNPLADEPPKRKTRITGPHTFATEIQAEGWLAEERKLIDSGNWLPPDQRERIDARVAVPVSQAVEDWIATADLAPGSRTRYRSLLRNHINPYRIAGVTVRDLTPADVREWHALMVQRNGRNSTSTSGAYTLAHTVLQALVKDELLPRNVCLVDGGGKQPKPAEKVVPTPQQLAALVERVPTAYKVAIQVAAWCALRPAEWVELRRKDVERHPQPPINGVELPDRLILRIDRQAHLDGGEWHVKLPKGEKTRRVEVPPHIVPLLDEQLHDRSQPGKDGLLFLNTRGDQISPANFSKSFKRLADDICPGATPHSLRHFGGTAYAQAGATLHEVMTALGHVTPAVALSYQHIAQGRQQALAARMSQMAVTPDPPVGK